MPTSLKALTRTLMLVAGGRASRFFSRFVVFTSHELPDGEVFDQKVSKELNYWGV